MHKIPLYCIAFRINTVLMERRQHILYPRGTRSSEAKRTSALVHFGSILEGSHLWYCLTFMANTKSIQKRGSEWLLRKNVCEVIDHMFTTLLSRDRRRVGDRHGKTVSLTDCKLWDQLPSARRVAIVPSTASGRQPSITRHTLDILIVSITEYLRLRLWTLRPRTDQRRLNP